MSYTLTTRNRVPAVCYPVDDWTRLERLLILGSETGTYRATPLPLTLDRAPGLQRLIGLDGVQVVKKVIETSASNRAWKKAPALFVLAAAAATGSESTRSFALAALPDVARTGAELFRFASFVDTMRGWGRGLRRAIAGWYLNKPIDALAYDVAQYQGNDGWRHRDLLRLSHPKAEGARDALFRWVMSGDFDHKRPREIESGDLRLIYAVEEVRRAETPSDAAHIVASYGLTPEMVPERFLDSAEVWTALLERLPLDAMLRHLGKMTAIGLLAPGSEAERLVVSRLRNDWAIGRAGLQPLQVLAAMVGYTAGADEVQNWTPVTAVSDALAGAFYRSVANVPRTGKRFYLALDVSDSMDRGGLAGVPALTPRLAAAAMTLIAARVERSCHVATFGRGMEPLSVAATDTLPAVCDRTTGLDSGGTDCALPILDAAARGIETDVFVVLTDGNIQIGEVHPVEALYRYREQTGIAARLAVVGLSSTDFSIADPGDAGTLDIVGFDTATPNLIANLAIT